MTPRLILASLAWPTGDTYRYDHAKQLLWANIVAEADEVEIIAPVEGWAYWTHAARVRRGKNWVHYLAY